MKRELAPESADDVRSLLLIPLVRAERAWGHAMEIKQEVAGPGKVKHALRKRRRMLRRMAKATESALELARLAAGCGDPRTVLEAAAYAAWMKGTRLVEQETDWGGALRAFEEARRAFEELARAGSAADEAVFLDLLDVRARLAGHLQARGFTRQRGFLRMALGTMPSFGEQATDKGGRSMVIAGPEYG